MEKRGSRWRLSRDSDPWDRGARPKSHSNSFRLAIYARKGSNAMKCRLKAAAQKRASVFDCTPLLQTIIGSQQHKLR